MNWKRRDFLKAGGLTALTLGLNLHSPRFLKRLILAAPGIDSTKKVIVIFQRGGNDGINTVIPRGDPDYNDTNRPTLFIPQVNGVDLGNGFAQLNPMMSPLLDIYNSVALNGQPGPGQLAIIHRVGSYKGDQSHFEQEEAAQLGYKRRTGFAARSGFLYNTLDLTNQLDPQDFTAVSLSSTLMESFHGPKPIPAMSDPSIFTLGGNQAKVLKFLGQLPTTPGGTDGRGLLGFYGGPQELPGAPYSEQVYGNGLALATALTEAKNATSTAYTPENGAAYPTGSFGDKLLSIVKLIKRTPARFFGLNVGGWDTHSGQGGIYGYHGNLLQTVAQGINAVFKDLQSVDPDTGRTYWEDTLVMTASEFGRTSMENGSMGTDHAYGTVSFVAGGDVKGGVYNCDPTTWPAGSMFSKSGRYVAVRADFYWLFWTMISQYLGVNASLREQILPGYADAVAAAPNMFPASSFIA